MNSLFQNMGQTMHRQDPFQQFAYRAPDQPLALRFNGRPNGHVHSSMADASDNQLSIEEQACSQERSCSPNEKPSTDTLAEFEEKMNKSVAEAVNANKAAKKRPASSHESVVMKRPSGAVAPSIKGIPSCLTSGFSSITKCSEKETKNRKGFTSRAYHHIRKLAQEKGYSDEKSKMFGSMASQAGGAAWDKEFKK